MAAVTCTNTTVDCLAGGHVLVIATGNVSNHDNGGSLLDLSNYFRANTAPRVIVQGLEAGSSNHSVRYIAGSNVADGKLIARTVDGAEVAPTTDVGAVTILAYGTGKGL